MQLLAIKNNQDLKDIEKSKELIRLFMAKKFDNMSLSRIFDLYRTFDKSKYYKSAKSNNEVIGKIPDISNSEM
ncbi:hypothetical protein [Weissella oryzae]|nr:hypothetical protein [Weissella oryzae]